MAEVIWKFEVKPTVVLTMATVITVTAYTLYLVFSISVFDDVDGGLPSMSSMIAYSRGTTISFTLLVFVHGYALMSYLVIVSEYIGVASLQFKAITISSLLYWWSLILVSYLPLDGHENPHNIFALLGFTFALFSVFLHKHTFIHVNGDGKVTFDFDVKDKLLAMSEVILIVVICVLGSLFWFMNIVIAEYLFIGLILVDKYLKVRILQKSGLLNTEESRLVYTYMSLPNGPTSFTNTDFNF